ncbi:MAG: HYR domain-containing protein [candidate division Zixibacteria bacterium]|nr:HYR domain-containing protein [candidate division Zixibacteria bacterium]
MVTDKSDYAPGDTAWIIGNGFGAGEWVTVQVTHIGGDSCGFCGNEPWTVLSSASGSFVTSYLVTEGDIGESLLVAATGQTSGLTATTTFTDHNAVLTITSNIPGTLCPGSTLQVCANLVQKCAGGGTAPLPGRELLFYVNPGNCGVNVGQNANDSVLTDAAGNACATLTIPTTPGAYSIRVKFRGEDKPSPCPNPGNSACNPNDPSYTKRCVKLSSSNECKTTAVLSSCCTPPVITCPANIVKNNDAGQCTAAASFSATVTGGCGPITVACTPPSGSTFPVGTTVVTCTATNSAGQKDTCQFTVRVNDIQNPSISCPANITKSNDPGQCGAAASYTVTAADNCLGATVTCNPPSGSFFPIGTTTVTCTAADAAGNQANCSFTVTVNDTENPTISCPPNIVKGNDPSHCDTMVTYTAIATDNCPGVSYVCSPPSGSSFPVGTTAVTCTATDAVGNQSTCQFTVTVTDVQGPTIVCSPNIVTGTDPGACNAVVTYTVTASNGCPGVTLVCSPPSGSTFPKGVTTVNCTATDVGGNQASCQFTVTVNDTEPPALTCPANVITNNDPGRCDKRVTYFDSPTTDNCDGTVPVFCTPPPATIFPVGVTTVTCRVADAAGNKDSCQFTVAVNDNQPPVASCPADITTNATGGGNCTAVVNYNANVSDNCAGATIACTPPSGSTFPSGTTLVTCIATDASGNKDTCEFNVNVEDNIPPAVTCPANITTNTAPGQCAANVSYTANATDNCPGVGVACTPPSGSSFPKGTSTVTCIATDAGGRKDTCQFMVTVNDTEPPTVHCPNDVTVDNAPGQCGKNSNFGATATDNCPGITTVACTPPLGTFLPVGVTTIICIATDASGNKDTCQFTFTVRDNEKPVISCPANMTVSHSPGNCSNVVDYPPPTVSDNCVGEGTFVNCTPPPGSAFPFGTTTVTCVATDGAGNKDSCSFTVTITNQPPTITVRDSSVSDCPGNEICLPVSASDPDAGDILTVEKVSGPGTFATVTGATPINAQFCFTPSANEIFQFVFKVTNSCGATDYDTAMVDVNCLPPTPPAAPTPLSPADGATNVAVPVTLSWNPSSGGAFHPVQASDATTFCVQVSTSPAFATFVYNQCGLTSTSVVISGLAPGTTYYWRVNATNAGGTSNWSPVWSFTTAAGSPSETCLSLVINTVTAFLGSDVEVPIVNPAQFVDSSTLPNPSGIGAFSFLVSYDCACLQFLSARKGELLERQGWEFFTFRITAGSTCLIRVVAIADINNGAAHPNLTRENQGQWAVLKFRATSDRSLGGQFCPVNWYWFDCADNSVSDSTGNQLWVVKELTNIDGTSIDLNTAFPNNVANCDQFSSGPGTPSPKKKLCFRNGGVYLPVDQGAQVVRGDLNLNGLPYEPGDANLYENYFIYGPSVWNSDPALRQLQINSSDINGDSQVLTVADLVMLIRILTNDAAPLPKLNPGTSAVSLSWQVSGSELEITTACATELGGLYLRFKYSGRAEKQAQLLTPAEGMVPRVGNEAGELRILIGPDRKGARLPAGEVSFTLPLEGKAELVEAQASSYQGQSLPVMTQRALVPAQFALSQNYPNPFNPKTSFTLSMPAAGHYKITIYNLLGEAVRVFEGEAAASRQIFTWDGTDRRGRAVSSGIYFYKAEIGNQVITKKMMLIR